MYTSDSKIDNWMSVIVKVFSFIVTLMHKEQSNLTAPILVISQKSDNLTPSMKINSNFKFDIRMSTKKHIFIDEAMAVTSVQ